MLPTENAADGARAAEIFLNKTQTQYRELFVQSELMRKKLRRLTHQVINAHENERREISRELHDDVAQILIALGVELAALGRAAATSPRALNLAIARLQRLQENSVRAVHQFARNLRPAVLDQLGLIPALQDFLEKPAARQKLLIRLTAFAAIEELDEALRTVLFRVAQEAFINVTRHAKASQVSIIFSRIPGGVRLEVNDNGKSFQVLKTLSSRSHRRLGLIGMRERVELVGGTLTIDSAPGRGTSVRVEIPLAPEGGN